MGISLEACISTACSVPAMRAWIATKGCAFGGKPGRDQAVSDGMCVSDSVGGCRLGQGGSDTMHPAWVGSGLMEAQPDDAPVRSSSGNQGASTP